MLEQLEMILLSLSAGVVSTLVAVLIIGVFFVAIWLGKKGRNRDFVNYAPTLLTTLGIFGTFFGIVLGLLEFDQSNIETSIPPLLAGLKTAFITSLMGIFASLLLKTLSTIPLFKPKKAKEQKLGATPKDILSAIQSQSTETKALKDALVGNEESTLLGQFKMIRSDINDNAKLSRKTLDERAETEEERFKEFSTNLWLKMQEFADVLSKSATEQVIEALKQVITDFNSNLTEQFGDNFKQLNEAVLLLVRWQEDYKNQLEKMQSQYELGVKSIASTESSVATISEHSKVIPEAMIQLKEIMEVCNHQISELESHLGAFRDMRDKAVEAVPEIQNQIENVVSSISKSVETANTHYADMLTEAEKGINNVSEKLIESSETIGKSIDLAATEFTDNAARTNESLKTSSDYLQDQTGIIKQHLEDAVSDLNNTMRGMIEMLVTDAKQMSETMTTANQNLVTDTNKVSEAIVNSADKLQQRLSDVIDEASTQQINQARRTFEAMEESIRNQVGLTGEAVDSQLKLIDESMQQEINRVITEMGRALTQVTGKFVEDYVKLTQAMNEIVNERVA